MCGICGAMQLGSGHRREAFLEAGVLDAMTDVMAFRGPDDRGVYVADGVAPAVRRLSIVDVGGGHQPLANEDERVWAVQNGELYNSPELRRLLGGSGHRFATRSDTEVIPRRSSSSRASPCSPAGGPGALWPRALWGAVRGDPGPLPRVPAGGAPATRRAG